LLALDEVNVENFTNCREELNDLFLVDIEGQTANEDGTTIDVILAKEFFIRISARSNVFLLQVEGVNTVFVVLANRLRKESEPVT
jgi:hypothetical protein